MESVGAAWTLARWRHAAAWPHRNSRGAWRSTNVSIDTHDEQTTLLSLWSIARSPRMFGGHLPDNDDFTLSLMTNDDVLAVDQRASASKQLFAKGNQVVWVADLPDSRARYVAVFNIGDAGEEGVRVNWRDLGLPAKCVVRDLWAKKDLDAAQAGKTFALKPHTSGFYKISAQSAQTFRGSREPYIQL